MPWPVRWMKCSPQPASSITSRAAASTSSAVTPGRTAAVDGLLGGLQDGVPLGDVGAGAAADDVGAGAVGAVAGGRLAADVDDDEVAGLDRPAGQLVVRAGAVRARSRRW